MQHVFSTSHRHDDFFQPFVSWAKQHVFVSWARNGPKNKVREKEHRAVSAIRSVFTSERGLANDNAAATLYAVRTFLSGSPTLVSFNARNHDNTSCGDLPLFFLDSLNE